VVVVTKTMEPATLKLSLSPTTQT